MSSAPTIRAAAPGDRDAILALYPPAFPDEDLTGLVRQLIGLDAVLNLTAQAGGAVVGHAAFTRCTLEGRDDCVALLGPLCVDPDHQRTGFGRTLVAHGARRLAGEGLAEMLVLGDPDYYRRLGFDAPAGIEAPYTLPPDWADAWRSMTLGAGPRIEAARLVAPAPWRDASLWR